jgi:hypothetical protein
MSETESAMDEDGRFDFRLWASAGGGWEGTGPVPEWAEEILARDPDVLITDRGVEILHREGETGDEYQARCTAAAPPFTEEQEAVIRAAEYWRED